ncbi:MAG: sensor histidine kinase, partial [Pseudolysinimonas sp.]
MIRKLSSLQLTVDLVIAGAWFLINGVSGGIDASRFAVAFGMGAALALRRLSPALSLTVAWVVSLAQVAAGVTPLPSNLAILAVL